MISLPNNVRALTATELIRSAAVYAGTVSATVLARTSVGPSGVSYLRLYNPSGCLLIDDSFQFTLVSGLHTLVQISTNVAQV